MTAAFSADGIPCLLTQKAKAYQKQKSRLNRKRLVGTVRGKGYESNS